MKEQIKIDNEIVKLDLSPLTQYDLSIAGYCVADLADNVRSTACAIEIVRICSKTQKSSRDVAAQLESEDLNHLSDILIDILNEKDAEETIDEDTQSGK